MWFFLTSFAHKYGSWGWQTTDLAASFFLSAWPSCFLNWIMVSCAWRQNQRLEQFKWWQVHVPSNFGDGSHFEEEKHRMIPNTCQESLECSKSISFNPMATFQTFVFFVSKQGRKPLANPHGFASFLHQVTVQQHFVGSVLVILRPKRHKLDMSWTLSLQCLAGTTQNLQSCQACMFWYDLCHLCQQLPDFGFGTWDVKPWSAKTSSQCSFFFLVACCRVCSVFSTRFAAASVTACQSSPATMNFSWNSELFSQTWHHLGVSKI